MGEASREALRQMSVHMKSRLHLILATSLLLNAAPVFTAKTNAANRPSGMDAGTTAKYKAASPLNHTVKITRTGSTLKLDYELIGADGKKYNLWDINDRSIPTFSVYKNNVKVGDGTFEFG